jgi:hypothetical protein
METKVAAMAATSDAGGSAVSVKDLSLDTFTVHVPQDLGRLVEEVTAKGETMWVFRPADGSKAIVFEADSHGRLKADSPLSQWLRDHGVTTKGAGVWPTVGDYGSAKWWSEFAQKQGLRPSVLAQIAAAASEGAVLLKQEVRKKMVAIYGEDGLAEILEQ